MSRNPLRRPFTIALLLSLGAVATTHAAEPGPAATTASELATLAGPKSDPAERHVAKAVAAALANDFKAWLETMHPKERATPQQQTQLEKYTFKRIAKQIGWYVRGGDANSFEVARREDMGGGRIKLFLKDLEHPTRAPVPVALEELPGGGYGIIAISL